MNNEQAMKLAQMNEKENGEKLKKLRDDGQKLYITALYDKTAQVYHNITTTPSCAYAVRGFMESAKDEKHPIYLYPKDFRLELLGTVNTKTGLFEQAENMPEILVEAESVVIKNK